MITNRKHIGFSVNEVCKIAGISPRQLRYWTEIRLVRASASSRRKRHRRLRYNLRDIMIVLIIKKLREQGVSLQRIRKSVDRIRDIWGNEHPLASLRVACLAHSVIFKKGGRYIDPINGQYVLDTALRVISNSVGPKRSKPTERMVSRVNEKFLKRVSQM